MKFLKKILSIADKDEVVVDLNSRADIYEQRFLVVLFPFWGYFLPTLALAGILTINPFFLIPVAVSILFLVCYLRVINNSFVFQKSTVILPGIVSPSITYDSIDSVAITNDPEITLEIATMTGDKTHTYKIPIKGLTIEGARKLWSNLAHRCKGAKIEFDVRERLNQWNPEVATKDIYLESRDSRELSIHLDLRNLNRQTSLLDYGRQFNFALGKSWILLWIFFTIVNTIVIFVCGNVPDSYNTIFLTGIYLLGFVGLGAMTPFILLNFISLPWVAVPGAIGFTGLALYVSGELVKRLSRVDRVLIDYLGITSQIILPSGVSTATFLNWKAIKSVSLKTLKSGENIIVISPLQDGKGDIEIPVRALARSSDREKLQEAFSYWLKAPVAEPVLEAIKPRPENSYTDLWLASLNQVPGLALLTPLSPDTTLKNRAITIKSMLAAGGQGVTYLVQRDDSAETCVLKEIILPLAASTRSGERALNAFEKECKLLERIEHPQIARLLDHFVEDTRAYMLLEYVEGVNLDKMVQNKGPVDLKEAIDLALQMCDILEYLHDGTPPVVHRDFTPHNLIVQNDGRLKLLDFGVALEDTDHARLEKSAMVGKQSYMPLEQIRGMASNRSDIYAFGATLYYLLSGNEPEALTTASISAEQLKINDDHLLTLVPAIDTIVQKCTAQVESQRYPSAGKIKAALLALKVTA